MLCVRHLGCMPYETALQAMQHFTRERTRSTPDELWLLEHLPVFTLGQAGKREHILRPVLPVIQSDRGGQVTYHGPGQLVVYFLCDLSRRQLKLRTFMTHLEAILCQVLAHYNIAGELQPGAPGVYIAGAKIASIGLRVKRGCTYHGVSLNVAMDLEPFAAINPCGYTKLKVTQMTDYNAACTELTQPETLL